AGCGIAAVVGAIGVGFLVYTLGKKVTEFTEQRDQIEATYRQASESHPFSLAPGVPIEPARFDAYLRVRTKVAASAGRLLSDVDSSKGPFGIPTMLKGYIETARQHADALAAEAMSPDDDRFYVQEIACLG